jgi:DUF4097 and DUF4098 domain-containing protein YvlB
MRLRFALIVLLALNVAARADEWKKDYKVSGTPEVVVESGDGNIEVRSADQSDVAARVTAEGWQIGTQVRVDERQDGNRVEITIRVPHINFGFKRHTVLIELTVPRQSNLDLHSGDGHINVTQVKGNVRLDSGDGRMSTSGLDGNLKARTSDGSMDIQGRFDNLELKTGDGRIEARVAEGSKMSSMWSIETSDGSVRLYLPVSFSADLEARTGDGHIECDFPVMVNGRLNESSLRGKMNGGGQVLEIRTGDGNVTIAKD